MINKWRYRENTEKQWSLPVPEPDLIYFLLEIITPTENYFSSNYVPLNVTCYMKQGQVSYKIIQFHDL